LRLGLIAALSVASSAGLLVMVPALIGCFYWKKGTAAGALTSIIIGGLVATVFQYGAIRPLGLWPGVWSGLVAVVLFIVISLFTKAPEKKAEEFIGYLSVELKRKKII
jgi:solute:Na+ symporter, SSS family